MFYSKCVVETFPAAHSLGGERRRHGEVPGLLLDHPVGIPTSPWDSLAIWSCLSTPPPSEHTSCQSSRERTESNNQAKVLLSLVPGPLSGKLRSHSSRDARMCGPRHLSSQVSLPFLSSSHTESRHKPWLWGTRKSKQSQQRTEGSRKASTSKNEGE